MKASLLLVVMILFGNVLNAQNAVDFETFGSDFTWNGVSNPNNFTVISNPDNTGINTSSSCGYNIIEQGSQPWAGSITESIGNIEIKNSNIIRLKIRKSVAGNLRVKLEGSTTGGAGVAVEMPNTKVNEWESIDFDFSASTGHTYTKLFIMGDFNDAGRTGNVDVYIDDIEFMPITTGINEISSIVLNVFPNPASDYVNISSKAPIQKVVVTDIAGNAVKTVVENEIKRIGIADLTKGIYFLRIETDNGSGIKKIVKN